MEITKLNYSHFLKDHIIKKVLIIVFTLFIILLSCNYTQASVIVSGNTDNDIIGRMCRMPGGRIAAVIERNPDWISGDFLITFSDDDGSTWSTPVPIFTEAANQSTFSLLYHNDSLHLFYASNETGKYAIYHTASADGLTWNPKTKPELGWTISDDYYDPTVIPGISGNFVMIYLKVGGGVFVAQSNDGYIWDNYKTLVNSSGYRPRICKGDNTYLAVWHQNVSGNYDVFCKSSGDLVSWSISTKLTSNGNSHDPNCAWNGVNYMMYYSKNVGGIYQLYYRTSSDLTSWENEQNYTVSSTNDTQSGLFFENGYLYLMWTHAIDYNTDNDIMFEKIQDVWLSTGEHSSKLGKVYYDNENSCINIEGMARENARIIIYDLYGRILNHKDIQVCISQQTVFLREQTPCIINVISDNGIYTVKAW